MILWVRQLSRGRFLSWWCDFHHGGVENMDCDKLAFFSVSSRSVVVYLLLVHKRTLCQFFWSMFYFKIRLALPECHILEVFLGQKSLPLKFIRGEANYTLWFYSCHVRKSSRCATDKRLLGGWKIIIGRRQTSVTQIFRWRCSCVPQSDGFWDLRFSAFNLEAENWWVTVAKI